MKDKTTSPLKAIRLKCLDCCCGSANEVKLCTATACPLYPFRFGHNPNRAGIGNKTPFAMNSREQMTDGEEQPV